ncbi:MAG: DinB family protein [Candidatus Dormibacteria bacterium]
MQGADVARELVAYEGWANQRILATAAQLDTSAPGQGASWGSIAGSMQHVVGSHATWLSRFTGKPAIERGAANHRELTAWFDEVQAALEGFTATLTDEAYFGDVEFRDSRGNPHRDTLALLLAHLVNHGTFHRGEAALLLTAAGCSPGDLDMIVYRRMMDPSR